MLRKNGTGRLSQSNRDYHRDYHREEPNPMSSLSNLADAMLVLAVGIMIAVVLAWNLDIRSVGNRTVTPGSDADLEAIGTNPDIEWIESDQVEKVDDNSPEEEGSLEKLGTLLYDKENGTYYILK